MPRIVFMGTPEFAVASLNAIMQTGYEVAAVVTVPDRPAKRGMKLTASPVKEYAIQHNLPVLQPEKLRDPLFLNALADFNADIFVVVAFRMLPKVVWSMPRMGTFNLHASLLPLYRGAAPINWAIINGETETGVTTFLLNEKIDEGQILLQQATPIYPNDNAGSLHDRLMEIGAHLVVETLDGLFEKRIEPKPQPLPETLKEAPKIFKQDCIIDWGKEGKYIHNFVRGLSPYPAATATMQDSKGQEIGLKIFETAFECGEPIPTGTIVTDQKKELKIAVKDGFIKILSLQINGKKRITAEEFLRGYNVSDWNLIH